MADRMRWRFGDLRTVESRVDPETVIEIGDLVWADGVFVLPVSAFIADTVEAANLFIGQRFIGVAMCRSRAGEARPVTVAISGVFEYECETADYEADELLGIVAGRNQQVGKAADRRAAIGRSWMARSNAGRLLVAINDTEASA